MSNKQFECPRCFKRCGNAGALKTHMKTHPERECFSDDYSDEEDSDYEEIVISKKKQAKRKLTVERTKPKVRRASNQTQNGGKTSIARPKEISAAGNTKQSSAKKSGLGHQ